ncbi:hypothetical protein Tco_0375508 [Tanacetum coccineum]
MADLEFVDQYNMVACLERTDGNAEFHQIVDFFTTSSIQYALIVSPTIYASYLEQFWAIAKSKTVNNVKQIHDIVDGKTVVISESSMRSDLHFNDEDGITCLSNDENFCKPCIDGIDLAEPFNDVYVTPVHTKKVFTNMKIQNKDFSGTVTPLFASMLVPQVVEGKGSEQPFEPQPPSLIAPPSHEEQVTTIWSPKKVGDEAVYTGEDERVVRAATTATSLEAEQESGMKLFKIGTSRRNNLDKENVSKQGRNLKTRSMFEEGNFDDDFDDINDMVNEAMENVEGDTVNASGAVNTATTGVSAASASATTAGVSISTAEPRTPPTTTTTTFEDEDLTIAQTLVKMRSQKDKEKGKGVAFRAAQEESARPTRILPTARPTRILPTVDPKDKGKGIIRRKEFDDVQERMNADALLAARLQEEERE